LTIREWDGNKGNVFVLMKISVRHPSVAWASNCLLGESPVWNEDERALYFVDIKGRNLYRWSELGRREIFRLTSETGAIVRAACGGLIAAQRSGFATLLLDPWSEIAIGAPVIERNENRLNDGKCDAAGRFWVASMDDECKQASGKIWSLELDGTVRCHRGGFVVGNGFGWSSDSRTMYFTDSENRKILAYEFDLLSGSLGASRCFAEIPPEAGYPDGLVVDADDCVWSAHWDGWRITRYRPDGVIDRIIPMPVPRPTSLAFGGDDMQTLFVTSARIGLLPESLDAAPLSGALFTLKFADIRGVPQPKYLGMVQ
jgi:sugar lactone lactonase YvrE